MSLGPGTRLGSYEIVAPIGVGGMGEVYRARDTKLGRDVALKILPESFALDADRIARFQREAQFLASLNHPNIAAIHHIEESNGVSALVMELVEGETLADRIARGPIPLDEALPIVGQIAEALEAAHDQGIVHRDLKPANVMIRADGTVKVLDFGLAKLNDLNASNVANAPNAFSMSPTFSIQATYAGVILGTAAYMSPEQARGKATDRRADIWAFGCVLFEMITGKRAFESGETVSDAIAAILRSDPDWTLLPADTPLYIRNLLRRCLQKDPQKRLPHIGLARLEIDEATSNASPVSANGMARNASPWRRALPWSIAAAMTFALGAAVWNWQPWRTTESPRPVRLEVGVGADTSLVTPSAVIPSQGSSALLSPDGTTLAFVAQTPAGGPSQLYVRLLDQLQARTLAGTEDATNPFFSPDGQWLAFFANGKLKKISITGGPAITLCDAPQPRGGSWTDADSIVFQQVGTRGADLMRISSAGGTPQPLIALAPGEATQRYPQVLPGGNAVLFTSNTSTGGGYDNADVVVQSLPNGARKVLARRAFYGRYAPSGHLLYVHGCTLCAVPFDLSRLDVVGQAVPVIEGINAYVGSGAANFEISPTGTLVYVPGTTTNGNRPLDWMDRNG